MVPVRPSRQVLWTLLALIALHVGLAIAYASITPYRQEGILRLQRDPATGQPQRVPDIGAPDERQHVNYVRRLLRGEGLPVFDVRPDAPDQYENYQFHQPPSFYILAAGYGRLVGLGHLEARAEGLRLRILNALIGGAGVAGVFFLAWWGFRHSDVALCASAFASLLPMHIALSGAVSNDPLLFALCTWSLAVAALASREGWTPKRAAVVGLLVGLALVTKTTAVALVLPILAAWIWSRPKADPAVGMKRWALAGAAAVLPALILALPWWLRNQRLYGDPLAIGAFNQAFVGSPQASFFIRELGMYDYLVNWVGWWTARSFFGAFGYMDIFLPEQFYRVALAVFLIIVVGAVSALLRAGRGGEGLAFAAAPSAVHLLNGLFLSLIVVLFLRFNLQFFQGQARYLLPAIGPISVGVGLGLLYFSRNRWKATLTAFIALLLALNLYILQWLPGEFARRVL
jgi:4-amino-4-deoxy-L-arabinose transferase-like glycosyltransferase